MTDPNTTWLPNLVGGVSIWKLARDLNAPHLFDGRLLIPDTEGPDSLPTKVTWSVAGLLPLAEARASAPADVTTAIGDFLQRLDKVGGELKDQESGFHKFKDAFTVPGLEADGGAHYYFDPASKKLCVINWGASPRAIAGSQALVFGWQSFDKVGGAAALAVEAGAVAAAAAARAAPAPAAAPAAAADARPKEDEKKKEKKETAAGLLWGRPFWQWLLVLLVAAAIVGLVLYLLRDCDELRGESGSEAGAGDAGVDGEAGALGQDGSGDGGANADGGSADAIADRSADGLGDATSDSAPDGPTEGGGDAKGDGGRDAKADGGDSGAAGAGGDGGMGVGIGPGGGGVGVGPGGHGVIIGGHDPNALPHRFHFEPEAVRWRVVSGQNQLDPSSPLEGAGQNFEVILKPGGSFDGVKVQWQDASGRWHQ